MTLPVRVNPSRSVGSVRVRTTAAAVTVVGIALVLAAIAMVVLLRRSLTADVETSARVRADAVVDFLATEASDRNIPIGDREEEFVQIVGRDGDVIAASANVIGEPAVVRAPPGATREVSGLPFEDDPFLVLASATPTRQGSATMLVGRTLETVTESTQAVVGSLIVGIPLLLIVVAGTTWRVVGGALAPVEAMRAEVDAISSTELHRRVPQPAGGDEIARLARTMNAMLARLESGHLRQRRFVADAAHELRSPVASIRQHAEVARAHPDGTTAADLAEVVSEEDARLERIIEDLLLLSQMDEAIIDGQRTAVDLDDILFDEATRLRSTTELRVDTASVSAGRVSGVRAQLQRLVRNLVDNAARHARTTVALALFEDERRTILRVDDDGPGIPAPDRGRVFERFVRLEEARGRDSGGAGLGLAIAAQITAVHAGGIEVADSGLGGARIEVRFPKPEE